ncbi:molybdopterin molybdotransferase MoeA [Streptomyces sp. NPDC004111]|uniref:molybdopterin molybdotransferase MoeA n=1 Tax=Streptomyces sp. NPDC004111 TaxID=3364690 RepID=UPI003686FDFD
MLTWVQARSVAATAGPALLAERRPLAGAVGRALVVPLTALTDLPAFDSSAMDGWAVRGPGPWRVRGRVLAGGVPGPLAAGEAVAIATGAPVPDGAEQVLRSEEGELSGGDPAGGGGVAGSGEPGGCGPLLVSRTPVGPPGRDVRPRGQECRAGDPLLPAGTLVTPAVAGLAAACGYDALTVTALPSADLLVLGDELLDRGLPGRGRVRDALGPLLVPWLEALGVRIAGHQRVPDDLDALCAALAGARGDVVLTTGGSARGPVDHVRRALAALGARMLVDSVAVRPGHPMLLALLPDGRPVVGLPGNPLAAVAATATLAVPVLRGLTGLPPAAVVGLPSAVRIAGRAPSTALVPVAVRKGAVHPLDHRGPAMLRGLAACDALAVVPPEGAEEGTVLELLARPGDTEAPGAELGRTVAESPAAALASAANPNPAATSAPAPAPAPVRNAKDVGAAV